MTTEERVVPTELIEPLEALIFQVIGLTVTAIAAITTSDMTLTQWRAISVLDTQGSCSVTALAQTLGVSMPSASRLITRLKDRGLVKAEPDPTNRRILVVQLTDRGHALRREVLTTRRTLMKAALVPKQLPNKLVPGIQAIADAFHEYQGTDAVSVTMTTLTPSRQDGGA